jgi:hypothetical protein
LLLPLIEKLISENTLELAPLMPSITHFVGGVWSFFQAIGGEILKISDGLYLKLGAICCEKLAIGYDLGYGM